MVVKPFLPGHKWKAEKALATTSQKKTSITTFLDFPFLSVNWSQKHTHCIEAKPVLLWNAKPCAELCWHTCSIAIVHTGQNGNVEVLLGKLGNPGMKLVHLCSCLKCQCGLCSYTSLQHYWLYHCTTTASSPCHQALQVWFLSSHT